MRDYFKNPIIRARIFEFLGGPSSDAATSVFVTRCDVPERDEILSRHPRDLDYFLDNEFDIARSLWDRRHLLVHLDIEYVNFDSHLEPYHNPLRSFDLQEPVARTVQKLLLTYGIRPLHLLTGRGHHFVWQIKRNSVVFDRLAKLGRVSSQLQSIYKKTHPPSDTSVPYLLGRAFAGLGLVMEFLGHEIKRIAAGLCKIPVELTAVEVGPSECGREMISVDISEYGDPLHTRSIRVPFAEYRKHLEFGAVELGLQDMVPTIFMIPLHEMDIQQAIVVMRDEGRVQELAERASVQIPLQTKPMEALVDAYEESELRNFHDWFYAQQHDPRESWPFTYDRTPLASITPCVRHILEYPNDLLLKPAGIQQVVRTLLAMDWHPRHIAGLIRSKYERDFGWNRQWVNYEPGLRADFYTRVFAGLFAVGLDELVDYNCQSTREKGYCFHPELSCWLNETRESLLKRKCHDLLACGPVNGLLSSEKHH